MPKLLTIGKEQQFKAKKIEGGGSRLLGLNKSPDTLLLKYNSDILVNSKLHD